MKKIIILFAMLLIGVGTVSSQGAYEVKVTWSYNYPFYCLSELSSDYEFVITLSIYDLVNGVEITNSPYNIEDWDETQTLFIKTQTQVEDWCIEASSAPYFRVTAIVYMVNKSTHEVYCSKDGYVYKTCNQFSSGALIQIFFE